MDCAEEISEIVDEMHGKHLPNANWLLTIESDAFEIRSLAECDWFTFWDAKRWFKRSYK